MESDEEEERRRRSNTVPFVKTRSVRLRLTKELNFSEEEVNRMTPEEAMMRIREVEETDKNEKKKKDGKGALTIDRKTLKKYASVADSLVHAHVDETQMFPSWKEEHSLLLRTLESCEKIRNSESDKQKIRSGFRYSLARGFNHAVSFEFVQDRISKSERRREGRFSSDDGTNINFIHSHGCFERICYLCPRVDV